MNVAVLLAGIADPKWPLGSPQPRILSPFDESALEVGLRFRDADPAARVSVLVADPLPGPLPPERETLVQTVASHRPDFLRRIELPTGLAWDAIAHAALWKAAIEQLDCLPDVVVMGREFGDCDDATLPPCLAEALRWPFAGLVQELVARDAGVEAMRERASMEERFSPRMPFVASVTNDRRNKLRHPLMKNVMAARRAAIDSWSPQPGAIALSLEALAPARAEPRAAQCRLLAGAPTEQAAALADYLRPWRPES